MYYRDFLPRLQRKLVAGFGEVYGVWNLDLGNDFEPILCRLLRLVLPNRFGVCRGFVVPMDGDPVGDDVVVYDRLRYPTLRLLGEDDYSQKELVPAEAVYAYIEAKHTLYFGGGGDSLETAAKQVAKVKAVTRVRLRRTDGTELERNAFGMVFGLHARSKKEPASLEAIAADLRKLSWAKGPGPDCIVCGPEVIGLPARVGEVEDTGERLAFDSLFEEATGAARTTALVAREAKVGDQGLAYAQAVVRLLRALEVMGLHPMPWKKLMDQGLGAWAGGFGDPIEHLKGQE